MSKRTRVTGTRTFVVWLLIIIAVVLVAGIVAGVLFVLPQIEERQALEKHYQAAVAFQEMGDWAAAESEFKQIVSADAEYKDVRSRLAEVKAKLAEDTATATAVAVAQAEQIQARAQATATAKAQAAADALASADATATAQAEVTVAAKAEAATATAEAIETQYQRALAYIDMEKWAEAKAELDQVFTVAPDYKEVQDKLAEVEAKLRELSIPTATPTLVPTHTPRPGTPTSVPTPTLEPTQALSPTQTPVPGALFGLHVTTAGTGKTGIRVEIKYADGSPKTGSWVAVLGQKQDVSGNPVFGDRLQAGRTDNTGTFFFKLDPGTYAVQMGDLIGDSWGNAFDYQVSNGSETILTLTLARLIIGLRNADGGPLEGRWTGIYLQKLDVSDNPVRGDRIAAGRTDNTGAIVYDVVPGTYAVDIGDISGEIWGEPMNHALPAGQTTRLVLTLGRLAVGVKNSDGQPVAGRWVGVLYQKKDVSGNPARGDRFLSGRTDNTGAVSWDITAGTYVVDIGDIVGDPWGDPMNRVVASGETTTIILSLGRVAVGLKDASGNPIQGKWVGMYLQKKDVSGNITKGDRFLSGRTDNTGVISWDVTAGRYIVEIEGMNTLMDVPIQPGEATSTDGTDITVQ